MGVGAEAEVLGLFSVTGLDHDLLDGPAGSDVRVDGDRGPVHAHLRPRKDDLELATEHQLVRQLLALGKFGLDSLKLGSQQRIQIRHSPTVPLGGVL